MSPQAQRIAIAQACGIRVFPWSIGTGKLLYLDNKNEEPLEVPDYPNDLNAMAEAVATLKPNQHRSYCELLVEIVGGADQEHTLWLLINATAAQRAEAFLKTLNLWNDHA